MSLLALLGLCVSIALSYPSALCSHDSSVATIYNHCSYPVYLWSTPGGQQTNVPMMTLAAYDLSSGAASVYSENLHQSQDGSGISIKVALTPDVGAASTANSVEQFEYTVDLGMNLVFYDLSEINGAPFAAKGDFIRMSSGVGCPNVTTNTAYHQPDDLATKACRLPNDIVLTLCSA